MDEASIAIPAELDRALASQRAARLSALKRRVDRRVYWIDIVFPLGAIFHGWAYYSDRHTSSLVGLAILLATYVLLRAGQITARREAAAQLERLLAESANSKK